MFHLPLHHVSAAVMAYNIYLQHREVYAESRALAAEVLY